MVADENHLSGANPINTHFPRQCGKFENLHSSHVLQLLSLIRDLCPCVALHVHAYMVASSSAIDNCMLNL